MTEVILQGVVGSHAYGLNHADSDIDRLGVFIEDPLVIAGWDWATKDETRTNSGPGHDDFTEHEVRKFLRLVSHANPTVTELLWLDKYEIKDMYGLLLVANRESFLSAKYVRAAYLGYARQQLGKFNNDFKVKHARHTLRLIRQGSEVYTTGQLTVRVPDPDTYFALSEMTPGAVLELLTDEFRKFDDLDTTPLSEYPDTAVARDILGFIREQSMV